MNRHTVFGRLFPPPKYITLPAVGVDISDSSIKYVQLDWRHAYQSGHAVVSWGDIVVPDGIVTDGTIVREDDMVALLRQVKESAGAEYVRVALPEERAYIFETTLKRNTPFSEMRGLLEFKLEENVPLSPRDAYFDYEIVEDDTEEDVFRVVVTVYARKTIDSYHRTCTRAGLVPLSFQVEADAISRAVVPASEQGTYMIVDFGKTRMGIGIVHNHALMYTATIDIGGDTLSQSMRDVLGEVSEAELTKIKNTEGLMQGVGNKKVHAAVTTVVDQIVEQIRAHVQYWSSREIEEGERAISRIIFCGGSSNLAGFPEHVAQKLGIPVALADVWQNVFQNDTDSLPVPERHSYGYTTAIGLALTNCNNAHV